MAKYKAKTGDFTSDKGKTYPTIAIYEFDDEGFQVGKGALITVGVRKAKAIVSVLDEIKKFVEANLSPEEVEAMVNNLLIGEEIGDGNG